MLNLALHAIAQRYSLEEFKSRIRVCADNAALFPNEVFHHWPDMPRYSPRHHDLFRRAFLASLEYIFHRTSWISRRGQSPRTINSLPVFEEEWLSRGGLRCGFPIEPTAPGQPSVRFRTSTRSDPPSQPTGNGRRPGLGRAQGVEGTREECPYSTRQLRWKMAFPPGIRRVVQ